MDTDQIRKLFRTEDAATADEYARTAVEAQTNPEAARALWDVLLALQGADRDFGLLLQLLLNSVLIDTISERMGQDDAYALMIGRRLTALMEQTAPPLRGRRAKTA